MKIKFTIIVLFYSFNQVCKKTKLHFRIKMKLSNKLEEEFETKHNPELISEVTFYLKTHRNITHPYMLLLY